MTSLPVDLSIVVPAYNEADRLPATLARLAEYFAGRDGFLELIVVDDGSHDDTRGVTERFAAQHPWARLEKYDGPDGMPLNRGKGYAVRWGMKQVKGAYALFSDADLSTPIEELERLLAPLQRDDADVTIASRGLPDSNLTVHQPWYRERMGRCFNPLVRALIGTSISDTQCGFKLFKGPVALDLFSSARVDGFGFDTELIYLARKRNLRVLELPVTWMHREASRVNPLIAPFGMIRDVLRVRLNDRRGLYDTARTEPGAV